MKNTMYLKTLATVSIATACFIACKKDQSVAGNNAPAVARIYFTDHPTPIFDSVWIDIEKLEVKVEDSSLPNGGWVSLAIHPGVYDILRFRNGIDTLFGNGTLPSNQLRKLRLTLGNQNSVSKNGQTFPLLLKDNDKEVIANLTPANYDVSTGQVMFWIDFDAGNSIQVLNSGTGNNNGFALKPHIKIFTKTKSGRIEGQVLPLAADAIVMAVNGTDTATAIPDDHNGKFKILGLNAGSYTLFIDGQNGYLDTTLHNVMVSANEDTKIPVINLHQ